MEKLTNLLNIGPEMEKQLNQVGIFTREELEMIGTTEAWLRIQKIDSSACIHRLMALEGALQGIKKSDLSEKDKEYLRNFYSAHKIVHSWGRSSGK